ncbi:putative serine/threonine protein phosphatase [Neospora caninum Liverpool]|uniref:Putative serine/threonine protein phosphatase n=1 Tax=Neospora caninum (strain Liverpool) TaxID=572307 RepID=F0V8S1_NEOCL|nr:putative serine/threonine protein phosphatase [Neospora caninum Liverpool]CBZ50112.1 putative serine/threonine protein phosphatase [Neospora caninum Liverpool]|eukprot:XP_003880147.1 putative serine/threonine protein phosphatase [Neospora caninum Liverpool]
MTIRLTPGSPALDSAASDQDVGEREESALEAEREIVTFGIIADPQLGMLKRNVEWTEEEERLRRGLAAIRRQSPAFIIVLGDLVQVFPEDENKRAIREHEIRDVRQTLQSCSGDVPVLIVAGNHDLGNAPTQENLKDFRNLWGDDYYSFDLGRCRGIVLNSCLFFNPCNAPREAEDTPKGHFHLPRAQRDRLRDLITNSTVSHSFHGHLHDNMVVQASDPCLEQVVTSATGFPLGDAPAGFRMVRVDAAGAVEHQFCALPNSDIL